MIKLNGSILGLYMVLVASFLFIKTNVSRMTKKKDIEIISYEPEESEDSDESEQEYKYES